MKNISIEKVFIHLAVLFGILFMILTPPFQAPDEDTHFKKSYVIAEGQLVPSVVNGQEGLYLSPTITDYIATAQQSIGNTQWKSTYAEIMSNEKASVLYDDKELVQFSTMSTNIVGHIVPAAGIVVGKVVATIAGREPSIVFLLYFARFANLLLYVFCVSFSIYISPILKKTLCMLGLMPMALFISSTPSYDTLLIGAAFLFTALWFKLMFDKDAKLTKRYIITFGLIAFIFTVLKIVYLPLFILLLFIPKEKYEKMEFIKKLAAMIGVFLALYIITRLPYFFRDAVENTTNPLVAEQIQFILKNPIRYMNIFLSTIYDERDFYISSTIGLFGLADTPMMSAFIYFYGLFLLLFGIADVSNSGVNIKWYCRSSILIAVLAGIFGIFLAMYALWTPLMPGFGVEADSVTGVQGRYFIPLIPVCFLMFANGILGRNKYTSKACEKITEYGYLASAVMLVVSEIIILLRYWA